MNNKTGLDQFNGLIMVIGRYQRSACDTFTEQNLNKLCLRVGASIVKVSYKLWRQTNNKKRGFNKMPCESKEILCYNQMLPILMMVATTQLKFFLAWV